MEVAGGVHRHGAGIANWYIIEEGGRLTLVDAGVPGDWNAFVAAVGSLGKTLEDVEAVLLTHAHQDHIGFAERARTEAGAGVHVHAADAELARGERRPRRERSMASYLWRPAALSLFVRFARQGALRNVVVTQVSTFRDGETLDIPGRPRVIHAPGHTAGSCALHLPDRDVLLTGDVLATWNVLTGRKGPQIMPGGLNESNARAMESLQRLEGVQAGVLLPGHGEPWRGGTAQALRLAVRAGFS